MLLFLPGVGADFTGQLKSLLDPQDVGLDVLCKRLSTVHTAEGDMLLPEKRRSLQCTGDDKAVFELLQIAMPDGFEVLHAHYEVVHYGLGGHFSRHKDFVPVSAPGLTWWHGLLCLEAPERGGQTCVFAGATPTLVTWAVGDALLLAGAEHAGLAVEAGCKTMLKFDAWQFRCHGKLERYCCADGSVRLPAATLRGCSFFERLQRFEDGREEHSLASLTLTDLATVYAYLKGAPNATDSQRLHELLGWLCCPEAMVSPANFVRLQTCGGAAAVQTREGALAFAEMARHDFYELYVVLRRAEYVTQDGSTRCEDRGLFLLSCSGKPLFSTGGPWLGRAASRSFRKNAETRPKYALEPPLPVLEGDASLDDLAHLGGNEEQEHLPSRWTALASSETVGCVVAVGAAALRAVLHAQEAGQDRVPDDGREHPCPAWCQKMEALVASVCDGFDDFDCNGGTYSERSEYEYCNDGDGYYVSSYVSSVFAVDWLLCRRA
jgi:hypothetical protein